MKKLAYFLVCTTFLLCSCSSDPCEDINCVNGSCVDGTCECIGDFIGPECNQLACEGGTSVNGSCNCNDGYFGRLCDQNLFGIYHSNSISPIGCNADFPVQSTITNDVDGERVCNQNNDGSQTCFWFRIWLEQDLTFTLNLNQIVISTTGVEQLAGTSLLTGTFTTEGEVATLVPENNGTAIVLNFSNFKFASIIPADDCQLQFDFDKLE